jgi:hypothetical protein
MSAQDNGHELAQLNITTPQVALDHPQMRDFVANLDRINALAEAAPGFIWRLRDEAAAAPNPPPLASNTLVNMSTWRDIESLADFAYRTAHVEIMRRKREWMIPATQATLVLWWVPAGHRPSVQEAVDRLETLRREGPCPQAFTFGRRFEPQALPSAGISTRSNA